MAYQHLFGSASGGTSGAGYKTLAATPDFYNVMTDDELSGYNNYTFKGRDESPVKFVHCYKEYKQCFIQSAVSFEYDYVGRNSSIAHTLVLTESESRAILEEHICPFSPAMFMNSRSDKFERPKNETLPAVDYRFLKCGDREYNKNVITKFFKSDIFAQFVLSIFLSAENGYSVFIALPGSAREASLNAIRLMNVLIPAFPSEYRKKMGFMSYATDTYTYEDVSIYFVSGMDLSRQYVNSAYCFDLSKEKPYVSGIDPSTVKEYHELIRAVIGNVLSNDNASLNDYFNDILPKLDSYGRFDLQKINEIFFMWKFLSGSSEDEINGKEACRVLSSFYNFYGIVDNKAAFLNRINGFWEKEIEKCRNGGYAPDIEVFSIVNRNYTSFGEDDKRQAQRIWSFVLIYTVSNGDTALCDKLMSYEYEGSELVADVIGYIMHIYIGFLYRRDRNTKMGDAYSKIIGGYIKRSAESKDGKMILGALRRVIEATDTFYEEMGYDKKDQYELFSGNLIGFFEEPIAGRFNDAGLSRKFAVMEELKEYTCPSDMSGDSGSLGRTVYEHFHSSAFIPSVLSGFTKTSIEKLADDRKLITDLSHELENFHELENVEIIGLFQRFYGIVCGAKDISVIYELNDLVNKPEQQETIKSWVAVFANKFPDVILSIFVNSSCSIDDKANMVYTVDYYAAFKDYFENLGRDREHMMRDLNRLIADLETDCTRAEYKDLGLAAYREPVSRFINDFFFDKSIDRHTRKDNESMLKKFERVKTMRSYLDGKEKKHKRFGK